MKLYHGTSEKAWNSIQKHGLVPRELTKINQTGFFRSNPHCVYLTDWYPSVSAFQRSIYDNSGRSVIIEIDSSELVSDKMVIDDRVVEELGKKLIEFPDNYSVEDRSAYFLKIYNDENFDDIDWTESLMILGSIGYLGIISPIKFSRVAMMDTHVCCPIFKKPISSEITVDTYKMHKEKYKNLTRWIMGDASEIPTKYKFPWDTQNLIFPGDRSSIEFFHLTKSEDRL